MVVSNTSLQVLNCGDNARIVFFYGGVKGCQIGSELRSHKRKSARAEGAHAQGTPQHLEEKATESARELDQTTSQAHNPGIKKRKLNERRTSAV